MSKGFLLINKDNDYSSNKVDQDIRHSLNFNKVGHLGTLDPLAKGLLVLGINEGTRYFKYFDNLDKTYILRIRLGATSPSLDYETPISGVTYCDLRGKEEIIDNMLLKFKGKGKQVPPLYSAIKVNGVPSYRNARKDNNIALKERDVEIFEIKRTSEIEFKDSCSFFNIELHVTKGFYIRSFAYDFGKALKFPAMADLIYRTKVGDFKIEDAYKYSELKDSYEIVDPIKYLGFKTYELSDSEYKGVLNGMPLIIDITDEYILLVYNNENIAIYKKDNNKFRMDLLIKQ